MRAFVDHTLTPSYSEIRGDSFWRRPRSREAERSQRVEARSVGDSCENTAPHPKKTAKAETKAHDDESEPALVETERRVDHRDVIEMSDRVGSFLRDEKRPEAPYRNRG